MFEKENMCYYETINILLIKLINVINNFKNNILTKKVYLISLIGIGIASKF